MTAAQTLEDVLATQPRSHLDLDLSPFQPAIEESIRYLESPAAQESIAANPYWPKWDSPWWHMSALFEMGMASRIPRAASERLLVEVKDTHLPFFFKDELPAGKTPRQVLSCPCAIGNIYQILGAAGLDVDAEMPWMRGWFLKYQMPDGGLNCDEDAYRADANASSLVGTLPPLEAILSTPDKLTPEEIRFLDRGAACLIGRELRLGSSSVRNAEERLDEEDWLKPCFPRLYFYDVLRGLSYVTRWADVLERPLPASAVLQVVEHLCRKFPDGRIRPERRYDDVKTRWVDGEGRKEVRPATHFRLQSQVSELNQASPFLTMKWQEALRTLDKLLEAGRIA